MPSRLPSDPPDEGRHSYHHGDLAPALVRAAEKLVAGHGAEEVSLTLGPDGMWRLAGRSKRTNTGAKALVLRWEE